MARPVEITTRIAAVVDELSEAWEVVMAALEKVGSAPMIEIRPMTAFSQDPPVRRFVVAVSGSEDGVL